MSYEINPPLSSEQVRWLLDELCVVQGFCLPPQEQSKLEENPPTDSETFANEVFHAEGLRRDITNKRLWRGVCEMIETHFKRAEIARESARS